MRAPLIRGVDYTVEEGRVVLTRAYHLKRGFCCNSKCRNCPYGEDASKPVEVLIIGLADKSHSGKK